MLVDVSKTLDCSATKAWNEVQKTSLHRHIIWPLARIEPVGSSPFPERWTEGLTVQCKLLVFQVIPIGVHTLYLERIDQKNYEIQSREYDPVRITWFQSSRSITADASTVTSILTPATSPFAVWGWANWFYRHRQRRWRALAKTL
jgi:hypothetical protein